jgi:hypothetical protein
VNKLPLINTFTVLSTVTPASEITAPLELVVVILLKFDPTIITELEPAMLINEVAALPSNERLDTFTDERIKLLPPTSVMNEYITGVVVLSFVIVESLIDNTPPLENEKNNPRLLFP